MLNCCSISTSFSTVVIAALMPQKPADLEMKTFDPQAEQWLNSPLLSQGQYHKTTDPVHMKCMNVLVGANDTWYQSIVKSRKLNNVTKHFLEADITVSHILRYVTAAYLWHSPLVYKLVKANEMNGGAIKAAYSMACQILQQVNNMHQNNGKQYDELNKLFFDRSKFLLNIQPMWYVSEVSKLDKSILEAYQLLKNTKEIDDEDEDEDEDEDYSIEDKVNDAVLQMVKNFLLSDAPIAQITQLMDARSVVAESRAVSFEFFSNLLTRTHSANIRSTLTDSLNYILEYQDENDYSVRKFYFGNGLEGSLPIFINRVSKAFSSIIHSSLQKMNDKDCSSSKKVSILYSLSIPYLPKDASLLQQSDVMRSLSSLWSFCRCFYSSRFVAKPAVDHYTSLLYTGDTQRFLVQDNQKMESMKSWTNMEIPYTVDDVVLLRSSLFVRTTNGQVIQITPDFPKGKIYSWNKPIQSIFGSPAGDHLVMISSTGQVLTTGLNDMYQCGRVSVTDKECSDVNAILNSLNCRITSAACGKSHTILLGNDEVFGCGSNQSKELGIQDPIAKVPVQLKKLKGKSIRFIACGDHFSLFASRNSLFGTGDNSHGQLGMDPSRAPVVSGIIEIELPQKVKDEFIAGISAGRDFIALWTVSGSVFMMGNNSCGQLGLGHHRDKYELTELVNVNVRSVVCGVDYTFLICEDSIWGMGMNDHGQLGVASPLMSLFPIISFALPDHQPCKIAVSDTTSVLYVAAPPRILPDNNTENELKVSYAAWMLTNLLFSCCTDDQLELSKFSHELLHVLLREINAISQLVGERCVADEWSNVSPRSFREGSVGMITQVLSTCLSTTNDSEANFVPFTYINQILTIIVSNARHSRGLVNALKDEEALNVLLPLLLQLFKLHESMATSSSCQYLYLDNIPYTTPLLLCLNNLVSLLIMVLPHMKPSVITSSLTTCVSSHLLTSLSDGIAHPSKDSLFPAILLRQMGRIVVIPYGPTKMLIPAPYFARLIASKCQDLIWAMLPSSEWNRCIMTTVFASSNLAVNVSSVVRHVLQQPVEESALNELYVVAGSIAFFAGFPSVPSIGASIAVTIGTLRQDGRILMFKDRKRKYDWKGACIIKLNGSKELAWVSDVREMTLVTNRIPIESYSMLQRTFENYNSILNVHSTIRRTRNLAILSQLQELTMYSIMSLLQFPQAVPFVTLSSIRCIMNHVHVPIPVQYSSSSSEALHERQQLVEGLWKIQAWESIRSSFTVTKDINYSVNIWPPPLPYGMRRCNVCRFPNNQDSTSCVLCGARCNTTLSELVDAAKNKTDMKQQQNLGSIRNSISLNGEKGVEDNLGLACKWMFFESIIEPSEAKCTLQGKESWNVISMMNSQKRVLRLSPKCSVRFQNPYIGCDEGVYLNEWTIIMDVVTPDIKNREYTCLLQTDPTNKHPGSFFIRKDGSCGIGVYSPPDVIKTNCFHRIIICADLPNHFVKWYVDGKKQGELSPETLPGAKVLIDDRWSIDTEFIVGSDNDPACVGTFLISSLQLRRKIVQDREASQIGIVTFEGPPEPSNEDIIIDLAQELHVPRSWCSIALSNVGVQNENTIRQWIQQNTHTINRIMLTEAKGLQKLGYEGRQCKRLILVYGSRQKALERLEGKIPNSAVENDEEITKHVDALEQLEYSIKENKLVNHVGIFNGSYWSCCKNQFAKSPGCTEGYGRSMGIIKVGDRVRRGPQWKWGNQDGSGFGYVKNITNWDSHLSKGVEVLWDSGGSNLYRWNVNGCFDLAVIGEASNQGAYSLISTYGNDSAEDNPSYEIVDDIKLKFNDKHTKRHVRFPDITDATLPEIQQELYTTSRALCSSYSRIALLNLLSLANDKTNDKINTYSLFMDSRDNLFQFFLSAFIQNKSSVLSDIEPQLVLKREVKKLLIQDVEKAKEIIQKSSNMSTMLQEYATMWRDSFSRRMLDNLLFEISLLAQPVLSTAQKTLPLVSTTSYRLIAKYPERNISFWIPFAESCVPLATVVKCGEGATLDLPPTEITYVVDMSPKDEREQLMFVKPARYELFNTFVTTSGDSFSIWRIVPPMDYAAFGMVVSHSQNPPPLSDYVCIRRSLLSLSQATAIEKANEVKPTPHTFWTSTSIALHFYVSVNNQPPDVNLVFSFRGESNEMELGSIEQVGWMLDSFAHIVKDPSLSMGDLTASIFVPNILQGLVAYFEIASPNHRSLILNYLTLSIRRMRTNVITRPVIEMLRDFSSCLDTMYLQQSINGLYSPSFQALLEVLLSATLMCYDSRKEGYIEETNNVELVLSKQPYFNTLSSAVVVMEALCHREKRQLPLEHILDPFLLEILVRLRQSLLFQSEHPYQDMLHRQQVECPGATSLTFRFDSESCSEEDDIFAMYVFY